MSGELGCFLVATTDLSLARVRALVELSPFAPLIVGRFAEGGRSPRVEAVGVAGLRLSKSGLLFLAVPILVKLVLLLLLATGR